MVSKSYSNLERVHVNAAEALHFLSLDEFAKHRLGLKIGHDIRFLTRESAAAPGRARSGGTVVGGCRGRVLGGFDHQRFIFVKKRILKKIF